MRAGYTKKYTCDVRFVPVFLFYRLLKLILKENSNAPPSESETESLQGEAGIVLRLKVTESF